MREVIVDASVAIKWYIPEPLSDRAVSYLDMLQQNKVVLLAPDIILPELGNVLWKKLRRGELKLEDSRLIAGNLADNFPVILVESRDLMPAALEIAASSNITVYESLYLALAVVSKATMVTADRSLAEACPIGCLIELLG
jgi:predicted nucleic acid-binding protein